MASGYGWERVWRWVGGLGSAGAWGLEWVMAWWEWPRGIGEDEALLEWRLAAPLRQGRVWP